jgi:formyl-CoA transferase
MTAIGRTDLRDDPGLARNDGRAARMAEIDDAIGAWTVQRRQEEVLAAMEQAEVPAGRIYSAADIAADPHYAARGMIEKIIAADGEPLKVPGIVPKLSATPGAIRSVAPKLGEHTEEVLRGAGYSDAEIGELRKNKIL